MDFEVVGDLTYVETIATGRRIRELSRLRCAACMARDAGGR